MKALWERHPATARDISEFLPKETNWAYTTLKTMLTRLVNKNIVKERKRGNTSVYEPLISITKARGSALKSLMNQAFDGAVGPLMHFLVEEEKITKKQREQLIQLLQDEDKKRESK